eukprot:NODE_73_length_24441_cov_0.672952.p11 type:complete len:211 gc:universal NODE_73_length_24441_cov_0.672952:13712-13080(-)
MTISIPDVRFTSIARRGIRRGIEAPRTAAQNFLKFINKGNIVQLSIALCMGTAFNTIINSIVSNILSPIIGLMGTSNLENSYVPLKGYNGTTYTTVLEAQKNGLITLNLGAVCSSVITFILVSLFCYLLANTLLHYLQKHYKDDEKDECSFCCENIKSDALICCHCLSKNPFQDLDDAQIKDFLKKDTNDEVNGITQATALLLDPQSKSK